MKQLFFSLLVMLCSCTDSQQTKVLTVTIDPYLSFQNYEHFKRLIISSPDANPEYIKDFDFEWGYTYKLKVNATKFKSPLSDGSTHEYSLKKVISKEKVADTTQFKLFLDTKLYYSDEEAEISSFKHLNDSTYQYLDRVEIEVPATLTTAFQEILDGKTKKDGVFAFVNEKRIRLINL